MTCELGGNANRLARFFHSRSQMSVVNDVLTPKSTLGEYSEDAA